MIRKRNDRSEVQFYPCQLRQIIEVERSAAGIRQSPVVVDQFGLCRRGQIGGEHDYAIDFQVVQELNSVERSAQAGIAGPDKNLSSSRGEFYRLPNDLP